MNNEEEKKKEKNEDKGEEIIRFYQHGSKYGEFSNFYIHPKGKEIVYRGKTYKTSEHLYQSLKYISENASPETLEFAEVIRTASTAYISKIFANKMKLSRFKWQRDILPIIEKYEHVEMRDDWDDVVDDVMMEVLREKFTQDKHCQKVLLSTGNALLSECTNRDTYWGQSIDGEGLNMLGILLVRLRSELREKMLLSTHNNNNVDIEEDQIISERVEVKKQQKAKQSKPQSKRKRDACIEQFFSKTRKVDDD